MRTHLRFAGVAAMTLALFVSCSHRPQAFQSRQPTVTTAGSKMRERPAGVAEWTAWRDNQIRALLEPSHDKAGRKFLEIDAVADRAQQLHEILRGCERFDPGLFAADAPIGAQFVNLKQFVGAVRMPASGNHRAGFSLTDRQYTAYARPHIALPELLRSQEFLRAVSQPASYREACEMIERENSQRSPAERWAVLLYKSQFLTTPDDTTYGRLLIYVPGEPEKWIQFGIATPGMKPTTIHSFSMVAVAKSANESPRRESFIIDFWRSYTRGAIKLSTRLEAGEGTQNCYNCHKTPVIPIHPLEEYDFDRDGSLAAKTEGAGEIPRRLNKLIASYGAPYFGGYLDPLAYGPSLGLSHRDRSDAFFARATAGMKIGRDSFDRLREHMDCARCHNMEKVPPLNYPLAARTDVDFTDLRHPNTGVEMPIARRFVENGWMPPDNELTPEERKALWRCLQKEYYDCDTRTGLLVEWLRGSRRGAVRPVN